MGQCEPFDIDAQVPLFPLPNCVLLPGGVVPLHLFEPRYITMARDVLDGRRIMALALLKPGYEAKYYTNVAEVYPVVCVGAVLSHEQLEDGPYNILLQGRFRARVRDEDRSGDYRLARVESMQCHLAEAHHSAVASLRKELRKQLRSGAFRAIGSVRQLISLIDSEIPAGDLCDLLAHSLIPPSEVEVRQRMLEAVDVFARMEHLVDEVRTLGLMLEVARGRQTYPYEGRSN